MASTAEVVLSLRLTGVPRRDIDSGLDLEDRVLKAAQKTLLLLMQDLDCEASALMIESVSEELAYG